MVVDVPWNPRMSRPRADRPKPIGDADRDKLARSRATRFFEALSRKLSICMYVPLDLRNRRVFFLSSLAG